ncbi:RNA polymerase II mediator complex subunit [Gnomoniopsis smithogilvyi]|uniref:Mediator of RNA polymerase II transcription subunit 17 n=1 Tax=Gnomoniopsis smithogilvyi TaxID=1191159 RepID=A0A9W9CTK2_9PEZI|nr:RNA polymerase II mediator complex subunit [Gnomoniopsis smithogilvyi]
MTTFALPPLPVGDRKPKSIAEFIARVNTERGGFRNVTQDSLDKEIEDETAGLVESKEVDTKDASEAEDPTDQVDLLEFRKALDEVHMQANVAHQNAMLALDFISLILTKQDPTQTSSISPTLRELVGLGVLGVDKLAKPNMTEARLQDTKTVATGWKLADIDRSVDSLLTSASRLQKEMTIEAKYWADVLAVSDKGWTVTHVPNEPQNLGVRYGFSEASSDFRSTSLAPMRRGEDGSVELDCGRMLGESKRVLVTLEMNGKVIGRSALPKPLAEDAPLEDRVLEARNTIFAQELWHEMGREGRHLLAYGVRIEQDAISITLSKDSRIVFSLQALEQSVDDDYAQILPENFRAEALIAALNQLLTYAHRVNNQRRSRPNPRNRKQTETVQPYQLLRPVLALIQHEKSIEDATRFVSDLTTILHSAGIETAMFRLIESPISPDFVAARGSPSEALILTLLRPLECQFELNITPEASLMIHCRTALSRFISTSFHIQPFPPAPSPLNSLWHSYPPATNIEGYTLSELKYYLQQAVIRVLVDNTVKVAQQITPTPLPENEDIGTEWDKFVSGTALVNYSDDSERVDFDMVMPQTGAPEEAQHPELHIHGSWKAGEAEPAQRTWTWTVADASKGIKKETVEQVVKDVVSRAAQPEL